MLKLAEELLYCIDNAIHTITSRRGRYHYNNKDFAKVGENDELYQICHQEKGPRNYCWK